MDVVTMTLNRWSEVCVEAVGYGLPMNFIDENSVGYMLDKLAAPLQTSDGRFTRAILLTYGGDIVCSS